MQRVSRVVGGCQPRCMLNMRLRIASRVPVGRIRCRTVWRGVLLEVVDGAVSCRKSKLQHSLLLMLSSLRTFLDCFHTYKSSSAVHAGLINDHHSPHSHHHIQTPHFVRGNSDTSFNFERTTPQPHMQVIQRTTSDHVIKQPQPVPAGQLPGRGPAGGRVAWKLGSED
jgi:hypothetical protein